MCFTMKKGNRTIARICWNILYWKWHFHIPKGQNKIYVCLSSPDRPYFLTPDPKSFYGIWKTQEGNVVSKCVYKGIWPVFAQK